MSDEQVKGIQRYDFRRCKLHFDPHVCLCGKQARPEGEFVTFADHEQALAALEAPIFLPLAFQVMTEQPPQPTQIKFGAVIDPLLRLVKPIKLDVSSGEEAEVVVSWAEINEYGCGPTTGDALVDFGQSLRALYHELHAPDIQLGPDLVKVKATLDEFIVRRG